MTRIYYKEAAGALIFFDSSRDLTFKNVDKWKKDLDSKLTLPNNVPVPVILCANKCDLKKFEIIKNGTMDAYCETNGYAGWFETSVKDGIHIEEPIKELIGSIKKASPELGLQIIENHDTINLENTTEQKSTCFMCNYQ